MTDVDNSRLTRCFSHEDNFSKVVFILLLGQVQSKAMVNDAVTVAPCTMYRVSAPRCAGEATGPPRHTGGGRAGAAGRGDCRLQGGAVRSVAGDTVDWNDLIIFTELK